MDRSVVSEEAQRWLGTAEKLLAARDLNGAKSFAIRVREAFPRLESAAEDVVAVADTLIAGDNPIGNSDQQQRDWYAVLGLPRFAQNVEVVANQYRRLALVLNPHRNRLPYADEAFRMVTDAWHVLSNPSKKLFFDNLLSAAFSRYDYAAGAHLQEHQFLQRSNHQPQPQTQQFRHQFQHQHQHQPHQFQHQQQHQFFNPNPTPSPPPPPQQFISEPPPPQLHAHFHQQQQPLQRLPPQHQQPQPQQQAPTTAARKSPKRKAVTVMAMEEERPNLNNAAESTRPVRPVEISPPPQPPPLPAPQPSLPPREQTPPPPPVTRQREQTPPFEPEEPEGPTFWTACPFCFILYEYPKVYEDCVLRCQRCKRGFTAVLVVAPPVGPEEDEAGPHYFCCWGFFPLGYSGKAEEGAAAAGTRWTPFSPMFASPVQDQGTKGPGGGGASGGGDKGKRKRGGSPRFVYKDDDDDVFVEISSESDDDGSESDGDWRNTRKTTRTTKRKVSAARNKTTTPLSIRVTRASQNQNQNQKQQSHGVTENGGEKTAPAVVLPDGSVRKVVVAVAAATAEPGKRTKAAASGGRKRGGADWGRLDLNLECNNDTDEPSAVAANKANGARNDSGGGEDDNIEGIGFFEGLDEFLSNLPILNVVGDDTKAVKAAN